MFQLLSRSRSLFLAGLLGVAPLTTAAPVSRPAAMSSASAARAQEIQVELAWMEDAATFRCPLRAHAQNGAIEVTGVVPSAEVKARALKIASDTGHTVVDRITVGRVQQHQFPATPGNQLLRDVNRAVTDVLGRLSG